MHAVNEPSVIGVIFGIMKTFLKDKMIKRVSKSYSVTIIFHSKSESLVICSYFTAYIHVGKIVVKRRILKNN